MKTKLFLLLALGATMMAGCCGTGAADTSMTVTAEDSAAVTEKAVVETILQRRSIRKYKQQPVERERLEKIIECGVYAPNGMGRQSWEVRVVDAPRLLAEIDSTYNAFAGGDTDGSFRKAAFGAPVLIFVAYDTRYDLSQVDCGLLGGNIMVSARSMGIGTCCLGGICRFFNAPEGSALLKRLDFPETHKLLYAIALGYPDESPAPKPRIMEKVKFIE